MSVPLQYFILAAVVKIIVSDDVGSPCVTPNGENARCINLDSCAVIKEAIRRGDEAALNFYHRSICDTGDMVCCGSVGIPNSSGTELSNVLPNEGTCGVRYLDNRITNGEITALKEFPWMALLGYVKGTGSKIEFNCGGTLINSRYVLTAAHCIPKSKSSIQTLSIVRLGEWRVSTEIDCENEGKSNEICADRVLDIGIESRIAHPGYRKRTNNNDIGLLRLEKTVKYTESIVPICLPNSDKTTLSVGETVQIAGWGNWGWGENATKSDYLLKANVDIVSTENCLEKVRLGGDVTQNQVCAGGKNGYDSCKGDSGGPLMRKLGGTEEYWYQEGIVSWGVGCGMETYPAVYTRVSTYYTWILNNIL